MKKFGFYPLYECNELTGKTSITQLVSNRYSGTHGFLRIFNQKKRGLQILGGKIADTTSHNSFYIFDEETFVDIELLYDLIKADLVEKVN